MCESTRLYTNTDTQAVSR